MKLLIAGAGGHGRVVADLAETSGEWQSIAFLDDRIPTGEKSGSWPVVGRLADLPSLRGHFSHFFAAFGDSDLRLATLDRAEGSGLAVATLIHPKAVVSRSTSCGPGSAVFAGAVVNHNARIGRGCIINTSASVDHDCLLGVGVHVCPGAHLAGNVAVGERTWIGIGAVITQGISIGDRAMIGAGAVVVRDVRAGSTVFGVPAKERQS